MSTERDARRYRTLCSVFMQADDAARRALSLLVSGVTEERIDDFVDGLMQFVFPSERVDGLPYLTVRTSDDGDFVLVSDEIESRRFVFSPEQALIFAWQIASRAEKCLGEPRMHS